MSRKLSRARSASRTVLASGMAAAFLKPDAETPPEEHLDNCLNTEPHFPSANTVVSEQAPTKYQIEKGKYQVIFILGGPGVGKGTQCARLSRRFNWIHLSAGDLLRREQAREGSPFERLIATCIREGTIVPHFVTIALLKAEMELFPPGTTFLIDGFPREIDQAEAFEQNVIPMNMVLFFECSEDVMLKRLMNRAKTSGRTDDNIDSIMKRFRTYQRSSLPVISYYEEKNKVKRIPCSGDEDVVFSLTIKALKETQMLEFPADTAIASSLLPV